MKTPFVLILIACVVSSALTVKSDAATLIVKVDSKQAPTLPNTQDLYTLKYKLRHPGAADDLARLVRSFTPSTSRIIPKADGTIEITETAANLKNVYELVRDNDIRPTAQMKAKWQILETLVDRCLMDLQRK